MVTISYQAQKQIKGLSPTERRQLDRDAQTGRLASDAQRIEGSEDRWVSRIGTNKRLVWKHGEGDEIVVLTIVAKEPAE
jgi:hypothetical protein